MKKRTRNNERYEWYKAHGICPVCGQNDPMPGRIRCADCIYKDGERKYKFLAKETPEEKEKRLARQRKKSKKRYEERKAQGLCVMCGKPAYKGGVLCYECTIKAKKRDAERWEKIGITKLPKPEGVCLICDKPVKEGFRYCEEHYQKKCITLAKNREKIDRENHPWKVKNKLLFMERER